jgi:periplasmic mercuric ion binding protein
MFKNFEIMKTMKLRLIFLFTILINLTSFSQTNTAVKTEKFKVYGNCSQCKSRIEGALKIEGIQKADWNSDSKILTVSYNPSKIKIEDIHKKIASVGHDTEKLKADDKIYAKLPECCQYERKK